MGRRREFENIGLVANLLVVVIVVAALYLAREVFLPLILAVLLSFLLSPIVNRIQRLGISNVFAVLVTAGLVFFVLLGTLTFVGRELTHLISELPRYKTELVEKAKGLAGLQSGMGSQIGDVAKAVSNAINEPTSTNVANESDGSQASSSDPQSKEVVPGDRAKAIAEQRENDSHPTKGFANLTSDPSLQDRVAVRAGSSPESPIYTTNVNLESPLKTWGGTAGNILGPIGTAGLVTVFVLFLLIYREDMRDRVMKVISRGDYVTTTEALDEVGSRISKYLVAQTIVNSCYGITFGLGLYVIGLCLAPDGNFPNFILWGALATMLRFVPYIGPVVATAFPILVSVAVFPGYAVALAVVALIGILELFCNNVLEPWLYGSSTGLSSVAIIMAAVFWGWLWGPVGLLLSTPLTVCLVVLGNFVPRFRIFSTLLGEKVELDPALLFYQRLLSNNHANATELVQSSIKVDGAMQALDSILVPAFKKLRRDQEQQRLTMLAHNEVSQSARLSIANVLWAVTNDEAEKEADETSASVKELTVIGIPTRNANEELLLNAFAKANPNLSMSVVSSAAIADQIAEYVAAERPDAVVILAVPKGGFAQSKILCRRLRSEDYRGIILVCCCGKFRNFDRLFISFRRAGANHMTTSFTQTQLKLLALKREVRPNKPYSVEQSTAVST